MIVETVLGEGGPPPPGFLEHLQGMSPDHRILLVVDEVPVRLSRTGKLFAIEHFNVEPTPITRAKSMAGGFPVAAVVGRAEILDAVDPGALGDTYAGNPMACSAASRPSHGEGEARGNRSAALGERLSSRLRALQDKHALIPGCPRDGFDAGHRAGQGSANPGACRRGDRSTGGRGGNRGLLLLSTGTLANVVRFLMPLTISDAELDEGLAVLNQPDGGPDAVTVG